MNEARPAYGGHAGSIEPFDCAMSDDTAKAENPALNEFPPATREQWLKLVSDVLKGASFEKRLVSKTYDGLPIEPLYGRKADAQPIFGRSAGAPWQIMQRIEFPDPGAANAQALHDLANGTTGLALVFAGAVGTYGFGLPPEEAALARVLDSVHLDAGIAIDLDTPASDAAAVVRGLTETLKRHGTAPANAEVRFGLDWIGALASGRRLGERQAVDAQFTDLIGGLAAQGYRGPFAVADARVIHNAGGSEAQELAYALATALAYLRALEAGGGALPDARTMIYFRLAADADQFLTIAKFRALRKLWARVEAACGLDPRPTFIAAETAWRMMTRRDPFVNMLRTTMAVVGAGLGGADSIAVLPYTAAIGLPDDFARRIARNTQLILLEESHLGKVADPAAGAGGLEALTQELCVAAWSLFQEIERVGGAWTAIETGLIQGKVAAVRAEREKAIARRKDALTGTSEFPDIAEAPAEVLAPFPSSPSPLAGEGRGGGARGSGTTAPQVPTPTPGPSPQGGGGTRDIAALPCRRLAEPFEALRDAADRRLAQTGARPKIFLANLGRLADFGARATYAKNFFEAGGIEAVTNDGFATRDDMVAAFAASGTDLACLCGSDDAYGTEAVDIAKALSAAKARHIWVAGRPGEREAALRAVGVQDFIFVGCDVVAALQSALAAVGLA
jgi:methylmalonyl-CoA mutase